MKNETRTEKAAKLIAGMQPERKARILADILDQLSHQEAAKSLSEEAIYTIERICAREAIDLRHPGFADIKLRPHSDGERIDAWQQAIKFEVKGLNNAADSFAKGALEPVQSARPMGADQSPREKRKKKAPATNEPLKIARELIKCGDGYVIEKIDIKKHPEQSQFMAVSDPGNIVIGDAGTLEDLIPQIDRWKEREKNRAKIGSGPRVLHNGMELRCPGCDGPITLIQHGWIQCNEGCGNFRAPKDCPACKEPSPLNFDRRGIGFCETCGFNEAVEDLFDPRAMIEDASAGKWREEMAGKILVSITARHAGIQKDAMISTENSVLKVDTLADFAVNMADALAARLKKKA